MRLIASGRLLAPDSALLSVFKMKDADYVHAVVAPPGVQGGQQAAMAAGVSSDGIISRRLMRNSGVGPTGVVWNSEGDYDDDEEFDVESGRPLERRGLDRLRSQGLNREEIAAIRLYFRPSIELFFSARRNDNTMMDAEGPEQSAALESSTATIDAANSEFSRLPRSERLRIEEEWMETQGPTSEFRLNLNMNNAFLYRRSILENDSRRWNTIAGSRINSPTAIGSDKDFLWGFFLGFFVGFVMLFWVWMPTVPHKQKLGILTGISFQMALGMLRSTENNENPNVSEYP